MNAPASTRRLHIVLLGTFGQQNIGDDLLLETFLGQLGTQHHYTINSYDPAATLAQIDRRYDVEVIDTARERVALIRRLLRADHLVFAGGSIIKELNPSIGRNRYATLLMVLGVVTFAHRIARLPIWMCNVGVGPIESSWGRRLGGMIVRRVDLLLVRDTGSYHLAQQLGIAPNHLELGCDAVFVNEPCEFALPSSTPEPRSPAPLAPAAGPVVGPVVGPEPQDTERDRPLAAPYRPVRIGLNLNFDIANGDNWDYLLDSLERVLRTFAQRHQLEIVLLPMQSGFKRHHDLDVLELFAKRLPAVRFVSPAPRNHQEVGAAIAQCDVIIAERLHTMVIAAILGRPTLVLAYDVKVTEGAAMLNITDWVIDINARFDIALAERRLDDLLAHAPRVSAQLTQRVGQLQYRACRRFALLRAEVNGDTSVDAAEVCTPISPVAPIGQAG